MSSLARLTLLLLFGPIGLPGMLLAADPLTATPQGVAQVGFHWELGPTGSKASLRGLSLAGDGGIWTCGSAGTVLRSTDNGNSWILCGPKDFEDVEFRSIHAFSTSTATIASAGTPAVILTTTDGGQSWIESYRHSSPKAFFDGLRFWNRQQGIAFSDPIDEVLLIVETNDGGKSWTEIPAEQLPQALAGEAGFAASNSSLAVGPNGAAWIGTGGQNVSESRVHFRPTMASKWSVATCPLASSSTQGIFSIARSDTPRNGELFLVAVGGDYRPEQPSSTTAAFSRDSGRNWQLAIEQPPAYRSAVVFVPALDEEQAAWIATGPTGSDWSADGQHWQTFSEHGFHALAVRGRSVYAVGADGRFAKLD